MNGTNYEVPRCAAFSAIYRLYNYFLLFVRNLLLEFVNIFSKPSVAYMSYNVSSCTDTLNLNHYVYTVLVSNMGFFFSSAVLGTKTSVPH